MEDTRESELQRIVDEGKDKTINILSKIQGEFDTRKDFIVKPNGMVFTIKDNNGQPDVGFRVEYGEASAHSLTHYARNQLFSKCKIPVTYADRLLELGENDLLLNNLNTMNARCNEDGILVRHINGLVKGVLSPSYRRMDASPIFESFVESCLKDGYVPYDGRITDYRYHLSFILPEVFNPCEGEYVVFGLAITTSDYGASALKVEQVILRITCKNLALGNDIMRSIHIGKRFETMEDYVQLSDNTHMLDSKAVASAVSDVVKTAKELNNNLKMKIEQAMCVGVGVNLQDKLNDIKKKGFSKRFAESVGHMYESDLPVKLLPKNKTAWRLSNAISLVAGSQENQDVVLDAQKLAMSVL